MLYLSCRYRFGNGISLTGSCYEKNEIFPNDRCKFISNLLKFMPQKTTISMAYTLTPIALMHNKWFYNFSLCFTLLNKSRKVIPHDICDLS